MPPDLPPLVLIRPGRFALTEAGKVVGYGRELRIEMRQVSVPQTFSPLLLDASYTGDCEVTYCRPPAGPDPRRLKRQANRARKARQRAAKAGARP